MKIDTQNYTQYISVRTNIQKPMLLILEKQIIELQHKLEVAYSRFKKFNPSGEPNSLTQLLDDNMNRILKLIKKLSNIESIDALHKRCQKYYPTNPNKRFCFFDRQLLKQNEYYNDLLNMTKKIIDNLNSGEMIRLRPYYAPRDSLYDSYDPNHYCIIYSLAIGTYLLGYSLLATAAYLTITHAPPVILAATGFITIPFGLAAIIGIHFGALKLATTYKEKHQANKSLHYFFEEETEWYQGQLQSEVQSFNYTAASCQMQHSVLSKTKKTSPPKAGELDLVITPTSTQEALAFEN